MKIDHLYGTATIRPEWRANVIQASPGGSMFGIEMWEWGFAAFFLAVFAAIGVAAYHDSQRPWFELKKEDWKCSASHEETITTFVNMGDGKTITMMPITTVSTVCDQWSHR